MKHEFPIHSGLVDQVVIYTGAAGLIGRATCMQLAKAGARLCLVDPAAERLDAFANDIAREIPDARLLAVSDCDTSSATAIDELLDRVEVELGPIGSLINSAYPRTSDWHLRFEQIPMESWRENVDAHLNGYVLMSQRVSLRMIPQKQGNIIHFGSIYGMVGPDFNVYEGLGNMTMPAAYSVIKGGIVNFTRYLASYLGPHGIRVNAICPGGVKDAQALSFIAAYEKRVPLRRMANVEDIVGPMLFLVSDLSRYMTGVILPVDGGWTAI